VTSLRCVEVVGTQPAQSGCGELRLKIVLEATVLVADHPRDAGPHDLQLLAGKQAGRIGPGAALRCQMLQSADANPEELVEVVGGDREKLESLEERDGRIEGLVQHTLVEFEPAQLAIEVLGRRSRHTLQMLRFRGPGGAPSAMPR
jgi:hypothetical protein